MKKLVLHLTFAFIVISLFVPNIYAETIDFEGLPVGSTVDQVFGDGGSGPILVTGLNPIFPVPNAAVIFDSANPTGGDFDLGTPNNQCPGGGPGNGTDPAVGPGGAFENCTPLENVLIIQNRKCLEGVQADCPDDLDFSARDGATITLDFSSLGSVTVDSINVIDIDGNGPDPRVELFDEFSNLLDSFSIPQTPGNGVAVVSLGPTSNVVRMVVHLNGSGAFDNIIFQPDDGVGTGRFTGGGNQIRVDGVRVTRGLTIHCDLLLSNNLEVNWNGNSFHMTEHLETVECSDDPNIDQAPPAAPLDTLIGVGTGRYNNVDGFTIEFTLVDAGEPGRDDQAALLIYETADPANVVLEVPLQNLDGGNLQAHFDQPHK